MSHPEDEHWRAIENIQMRIRHLSATLGWVLDDHAHREVELELGLAKTLAAVAWEINELSNAIEAVVERWHTGTPPTPIGA